MIIYLFFKRNAWFNKNNILSTQNIKCRYSGKNVHFVHISTSMIYEQTGAHIYKTDSPYKPQGVYSKSKIGCEQIIKDYNCDLAVIIPCIIGGIGREGLFINFVKSIENLGVAIIPGTGKFLTQMVHVNDVASLVEIIIKNNAIGRFNAASPEPLTINRWAEDVFDILGKKKKLLHIPLFIVRFFAKNSQYRLLAKEQLIMLSMDHVLDISNSINIGWNPKYTNHDIIFDLVKSIRSKTNSNNNKKLL